MHNRIIILLLGLIILAACGGGESVSSDSSGQSSSGGTGSYTLTVTLAGSGTVSSSPAGINCGSNCSASYASSTSVTLTANPATGYNFSGWGGACSGSNTSCTMSMTANRNVAVTFTTAAGDLPPLLSLWENEMTTYGQTWGEYQNPSGPNSWTLRFDRAYYDVLHIMYQIKAYTGQNQPWDTYIGYAKSAYRNEYYRANDFRVPGYRRFAHGLLADYLAGGDTTITDIRKIRDNPAFSNLSEFNGAYAGSHQVMSREMAYALEAHIAAEKAGQPRLTQVSQFVTWMENHLYEWKSGQFAGEAWFQPFMFGLTAQALIEFYEWEVANNRDPNAYWPKTHWPTIPAALSDFSDWMYNTAVVRDGPDVGQRMWVANYQGSGYGGFRYMDRNNTSISAEGSSVKPDLNALIAPVYAWVYKQTGSKTHRAMGDNVFAGGVHFSAASWGGKMFNQSYRWSIKFVQWRRDADQLWP